MPRLNPDHIRHCGGFIKPVAPTKFQAHIRLKGIQHRAKFRDLTSAKLWIEGLTNQYGDALKPLTREQLMDATQARAMLPDGISFKTAVETFLAAQMTMDTGVVYDSPTLEKAAALFLKSREKQVATKTLDEYSRYIASLIVFVGGDMAVDQVHRDAIGHHVENLTNSMRNATLTYLSAFFVWCIKQGYAMDNPCLHVDKARKAAPPLGVLSILDFKELLQRAVAIDPSVIPYLAVGAFAGVRPYETLRLVPDKFKSHYIMLDASVTKTANARTVEIRPNLRAWLEAYPFAVPSTDISAVNKRVRKLCQIEPVIQWPHDCLRHSFATYAYELTKEANLISAEMGHAGTAVFFKHYRALAIPGDGKKWFAIMPHRVLN